jgi:hypothetical protein
MNDTYQVILFKNKVKKKIINKFKTHKKAFEYYKLLVKESDEVIYDKVMENGVVSEYELSLVERSSSFPSSLYMKDDYGRQVKVSLDDSELTMINITRYRIEELFLDYTTNKKIDTRQFIKQYLDHTGFKLISKLNNKIIVQNDDKFNLFTLKTSDESERFIDILTKKFNDDGRKDCLLVKDYSTPQRKYLYELLVKMGFEKSYLQRSSTTYPSKK